MSSAMYRTPNLTIIVVRIKSASFTILPSSTCDAFTRFKYAMRSSRDLVQSSAKVHHAQLFVGTKIYSPYSISVATNYSRSTQNLTT